MRAVAWTMSHSFGNCDQEGQMCVSLKGDTKREPNTRCAAGHAVTRTKAIHDHLINKSTPVMPLKSDSLQHWQCLTFQLQTCECSTSCTVFEGQVQVAWGFQIV